MPQGAARLSAFAVLLGTLRLVRSRNSGPGCRRAGLVVALHYACITEAKSHVAMYIAVQSAVRD
jgi:hypothetical protein